jgi:hypothetical protein
MSILCILCARFERDGSAPLEILDYLATPADRLRKWAMLVIVNRLTSDAFVETNSQQLIDSFTPRKLVVLLNYSNSWLQTAITYKILGGNQLTVDHGAFIISPFEVVRLCLNTGTAL